MKASKKRSIRFALACGALLTATACSDRSASDHATTTSGTSPITPVATTDTTTATTSDTTTTSNTTMDTDTSSDASSSGTTATGTTGATTDTTTGAGSNAGAGTTTTEPGRTDTPADARLGAEPQAATTASGKHAKKAKKSGKSAPAARPDGKSGSTSSTGAGYSHTSVGDHPDIDESGTTSDTTINYEETGTNNDVTTTPEYQMSDEDSTLSGSTTSESETESVSTTSDPSFNEAAKSASMADQSLTLDYDRAEEQAKFYEPKSRTPYRVGLTSLTGAPRSHAQAGPVTIFTDPTVAPAIDATLKPKDRIANVNLEKFPVEKRGDFKRAMNHRLSRMETRIDYLKGDVAERASTPVMNPQSLYQRLEAKEEAAAMKLKEADSVSADRWNQYKREFRDQIADLERSYDETRTAVR